MRLATVLPFPSKLRTVAHATPVAERSRQNDERQACVDEIIRRQQILELFVEAAHAGHCGSPSLKRRWDADEREYEARAFQLRMRRIPSRSTSTATDGDDQ